MMSFIEHCSEFWGETEHLLSGENKARALRWSIFVKKQKHNVLQVIDNVLRHQKARENQTLPVM